VSFASEPGADETEGQSELVTLGLLALLVGAVAGLVTALFRLALDHADSLRDALIAWAHGWHFAGLLFVVATCAAAVAAAAWLVRRYSPYASGSGIPYVEAVLKGELRQAPYRLIWVKFCGGLLAIGSGLALGREGPSVQMGASLANLLGEIFRRNANDCKALLAAGAGAGLATAFNAPIGGAVFVLEELTRRFDTRITIATLGASAGAIAVARVLLGDTPDFLVERMPYPGFGTLPIYLSLGIIAGCLGVIYNHAILATLAVGERLREWPVEARAAVVGALVGLLAWFVPGLVGGGDTLTQRTLAGAESVATVSAVFLVRFALGPLSYAAGTPGGLFAPILVLGAQTGFLFANFFYTWFPAITPISTALAVIGMAAFFTAVVRAPLTGIILVIEMTASFTLFLPMLGACFAAMLVPTLLRNAPIYDSLRERTLERNRTR
jgi:CIC family chloride channel protein